MQTEADTAKQFCQKVIDSENEYQVGVRFSGYNAFLILVVIICKQ